MSQHPARLAVAALAGVALLAGCAAEPTTNSSSSPASSAASSEAPAMITVKIGNLQTDDILPLWVADKEGLDEANGLDLQITNFPSAAEQQTAIVGGAVDGLMTDMVVPVQLSANGTVMKAVTKLQGAPAGIVAAGDSGITEVSQLAGVEAGLSSPTVMEYIYDKALADAGVPEDQILAKEVKAIPARLELLNSGQLKAAMLPWTMYALAVDGGAIPVLDEPAASHYTTTVLSMSQTFLDTPDANEAVTRLLKTWDDAVAKVNADPEGYRTLLAETANLPEQLQDSYKMREYPTSGMPDETQWTDVVDWMVSKGYIEEKIPYADLVYTVQ
jgi:NitT/TauT family transport system substrate-binding protein